MSNPQSPKKPVRPHPKGLIRKPTDLGRAESPLRGAAHSVPDTVPGDPPVPITAWYLPKPRAGTKVPVALVRRLMANYTQPGTPVVNLSGGQRLARLRTSTASLIITDWPRMVPSSSPVNETKGNGRAVDDSEVGKATARGHLEECAAVLEQGGCLAVVVTSRDIPDALGVLVRAARAARMRYLQHIVVVHQVNNRGSRRGGKASEINDRSLRVHTDVLMFIQPDPRPGARSNIPHDRDRGSSRRPRT